MSVKGFDFELNGVKYDAAEDAQGEAYTIAGEPLRPPNAQVVQGAAGNQVFQMKPDTLLWSLSDWSGGEGQQIWNLQNSSAWRTLDSVDPFVRPGTVRPGPYLELTQHDSAGGDFDLLVMLVAIDDKLFAFDVNNPNYYTWNTSTEVWDGPQAITGPAGGATCLCHDGDKIFWLTYEDPTPTLWSMDPAGTTATQLANTVMGLGMSVAAQGDNIYIGADVHTTPPERTIHEVAKSGGTPVEIDRVSIKNVSTVLVPMEGKVYSVTSDRERTEIREITPTSAAGTGFGRQFALLEGFGAHGAWHHSGILYMAGQYGFAGRGQILYVEPRGTYGSLPTVRKVEAPDADFMGGGRSVNGNARLIEHYFVTAKRSTADDSPSLWVADAVSGGYANHAYPDADLSTYNVVRSLQVFRDEVFFAGANTAGDAGRIFRAAEGEFMKSSAVVSPWHNFGLADEKLLASLALSVESLPADWTVYVDYAIDGASSFTTHITYTSTGGKGEKAVVSTDASTQKFHTLSIRVRMVYGGGGVPTSAPVVLGVDVYAQVVRLQKVYQLLLDLSDDKSGPHSGARKRDNIIAAADTENVLDFKDGYRDGTPGVFDTLDVVIDSFRINNSTPGEGVAAVILKEVV
jgi:hypothetical protein